MIDPKDNKTIGYHIFILPTGKLFNILQETINELAEKYQGPFFEPHLTLLGRIPNSSEAELIQKTKVLANALRSFEISLANIQTEDMYFRSFYYTTRESEELKSAHKKALDLFGMQDEREYIPHVSLYYGNIQQSVKDEMRSSLLLPNKPTFFAETVYLYKTNGEPKNWVRVGAYPLGE